MTIRQSSRARRGLVTGVALALLAASAATAFAADPE